MTDWHTAFAGHLQPGTAPALLLVDPVRAYVDAGSPLLLETGAAAVAQMARLAAAFRARARPVIWTGVRYQPGGADGGYFFKKVPALELFVGETPAGSFPHALQPEEGEPVFLKQYPSAFFGTGLAEWLRERGIDTLYIGGFSTSGCVRASTLDALQYGFIPITVSDACADRNAELHGSNLRDLGAKYAEIVVAGDVPHMLETRAVP
ncbi:MAG: isochorismatase family protein [Erythrobacter sp.]|jgi:maleamate amidohydrolase|nr:isochorismatase family protein [Erythrobacter sp.]